jgi:O-antigen ligase
VRKITVLFLLGYFFFQSWTNAFSLHPRLPIHVVFCGLSVTSFIIYVFVRRKSIRLGVLSKEDIFAPLLVLIITIVSLINPRPDSINYVAAYTYVFLFAFIGIKISSYNILSRDEIKDAILYGALVTSIGSILEFTIEFGVGFDLAGYLFRTKQAPAKVGGLLPRSMAFSTEPGILAFYLETLGLVSLGEIIRRAWSNLTKCLGVATIIVGWALSFSAGSVVAIGVGGFTALSIKWARHPRPLRRVALILLIPATLLSGATVLGYASGTILEGVANKVTLQVDESKSAGTRFQRWEKGLQKVAKRPLFGEGPGTASSEGRVSNNNWYLFIAVEGGLLSLIPVILLLLAKLFKIINSDLGEKYWFLAAFMAGSVHLFAISTFFHPFLWTLIITYDILIYQSRA